MANYDEYIEISCDAGFIHRCVQCGICGSYDKTGGNIGYYRMAPPVGGFSSAHTVWICEADLNRINLMFGVAPLRPTEGEPLMKLSQLRAQLNDLQKRIDDEGGPDPDIFWEGHIIPPAQPARVKRDAVLGYIRANDVFTGLFITHEGNLG